MNDEIRARLADAPDFDEDEGPLEAPAPPRQPSQVYSVRLPVEELESLRRLAADLNLQPSTLIREWVLERLGLETGRHTGQSLVDRVIDLEQQVIDQKKAFDQQVVQHNKDLEKLTEAVLERTLAALSENYDFIQKQGSKR
jgi:hypothetical protein